KAREMARRSSCLNNLKQIGLSLHMYSTDFSEYFPATGTDPDTNLGTTGMLGVLYPIYNSARRGFICPSGNRTEALITQTGGDNTPWTAGTSYAYCHDLTELKSSDQPIAGDYSASDTRTATNTVAGHGEDGVNILYIDGHVSWVPGTDAILVDFDADGTADIPLDNPPAE
ncbi:DUF1559 domain-containing protein, partial [bacterium]|nr:DUF1559 domain-containing protein [bacterium]